VSASDWILQSNKPCLVVDLVTKTGSVDNCEGNTCAFFIEFELCLLVSPAVARAHWAIPRTNGDGFYPDAFLEMRVCGIIVIAPVQHSLAAESIHKSGTTWRAEQIRHKLLGEATACRRTSPRCTTDHQTELNSLLDILLPSHFDLHGTRVSG